MEYYIKNVTDITYKSELTPHPERITPTISLGEGLNSQTACGLRLTSFAFRKSSAHLKWISE